MKPIAVRLLLRRASLKTRSDKVGFSPIGCQLVLEEGP